MWSKSSSSQRFQIVRIFMIFQATAPKKNEKQDDTLKVKQNFSQVYFYPDPKPYLRAMSQVDYTITNYTTPLYKHLISKIKDQLKREVRVTDIGSSYGINSVLINHNIQFSELAKFVKKTDIKVFKEIFQRYLSTHRLSKTEFALVDISKNAIQFATEVNLAKSGFCIDLNQEKISSTLESSLKQTDIIVSTGCLGYLKSHGLEKVIKVVTSKNNSHSTQNHRFSYPVFSFSLLRIYDSKPFSDVFEKYGYKMLQLNSVPVPQRNFYNQKEKEETIQLLEDMKIDVSHLEQDGHLYANLFIAVHSHDIDLQEKFLEESMENTRSQTMI